MALAYIMTKAKPTKAKAKKRPRGAESGTFPVVAVGASAGGLEAYTDFFRALPPDTGMAFVLVQHLDPTHHSMLAEILAKATKMPVEEAEPGAKIRPNRVYVIPPNASMAIADGSLVLTPRKKGSVPHLVINFFMRSLAEERKSSAIGVVLSGTGSDGTAGVEDIKAEGGITFAQEPETAKYDGMPRSAIDSGCVDFVLPPKEIARELARMKGHPYMLAQEEARAEAGRELREPADPGLPDEKAYRSILDLLRRTSGTDFSQYKPNTIHRRALRRMVILKLDTLGEYAKYTKEHPEEGAKLFEDVLIPVTSFFRDFEAFEALKARVYPAIVNDKANKGSIRMWAPGCSTGEETYSLAMTLLEFLGDRASSFQIQIFGTDLNDKGIQKARTGIYRESIADEISSERMARFFLKVDGGYRVNKAVRDMCVFARQNLANDPPFSQMNLVACRNLLIYIQPTLQKKIIPILHYALKPSGFLVLGGSESVSAFPELFSTVDKKHKIYGKKAITSRLHYNFVQNYYPVRPAGLRPGPSGKELKSTVPAHEEWDPQAAADRVVLKQHAPVGVVVNGALEVIQFRGRTTPYLEQAPGKPSLNVLKLAQNGLALELRTLIAAAQKTGLPTSKNGVQFDGDSHPRTLDISITPLGERPFVKGQLDNRFFLILFSEVTVQVDSAPQKGTPSGRRKTTADLLVQQELKRLRREAADAQNALRSAVESEEALKDEFQSANEEILSANEELQSANEELETSKEELQSANEELHTLNAELSNKNSELLDLSNDIANFLNSTRIPVVMLDRGLCIRRVTPTANKLLKVLPSDIGRPLSDIRSNIEAPRLEHWVAEVLETFQSMEHEVLDAQGNWHSLNILPYRTQDNKIDGVVLALQDISVVKAANEQLARSTEFFRGIIDTVREPLLVLDGELRVVSANKPFLTTFQVTHGQTVNRFVHDLGNGQWNIPRLRELLERVLSNDEEVKNFELEHDFENIGTRTMVLNARLLAPANGAQPMLLLAIDDVTERKRAETALIKSEKLAAAGRLAAVLAHEINNPLQAVTNLMELLRQSPSMDASNQEYATMAADELGRVNRMTQQSLAFYRESTSATTVKLEEVIESILNIYAKRIAIKKISVTKEYKFEGAEIQSLAGEIRQLISTLLINALEAVPVDGRLVLRISKSTDWKKTPTVDGFRITLMDSGCGIPTHNAARVFDPFFTTKGDSGTGLGLWVARGIVEHLGGWIRMRSRVHPDNSGTCFTFFLPNRLSKSD